MDNETVNYKIYDFLNENIYDVMSQYIPDLNGDFSVSNVLNYFNKKESKEKIPFFEKLFKIISNTVLSADGSFVTEEIEKNDTVKKLTDTQREEMLKKFRQDSPNTEFTSIKEYIMYAKENINNPETESLRKTIMDNAIDMSNEKVVLDLKRNLLRALLSQTMKEVESKNSGLEKHKGKDSNLDKLEFIYNELLLKPNVFLRYENLLKEYKEKLKQEKAKIADEISCRELRNKASTQIVEQAIPVYGEDAKDPISSLFCKDDSDLISKGEFNWNVKLYSRPIVLCDGMANYSKNGIENQRVVAVSYGKFFFNTGVINNHIVQPDLIGVSRIGKDGVHNYFVLATLSKINLKRNSDINEEEERRIHFSVDGKRAEVIDDRTGRIIHPTIQLQKIPRDLKDFFLKGFLSDSYLSRVIKENYRYAGFVSKNNNGQPIIMTDKETEAKSIRKALQTEGKVGLRRVESLERYCNSAVLTAVHLEVLKDITNGVYSKDTESLDDDKFI